VQLTSGRSRASVPDWPGIPAEVATRPSFLTARLSRTFSRQTAHALAQAGSTVEEYQILALLNEAAQDTQVAIAAKLGIDRTQIVGLVSSLEDAGHLHRGRNARDRRRYLVELTDEGRLRLSSLREAIDQVEQEVLHSLSAGDRQTLVDLLVRAGGSGDSAIGRSRVEPR
jgi:DNA-binding MarR family transcriptional regulator